MAYRGGYLPGAAAQHRAVAARRRDVVRGGDQRARARHRHRLARRGGVRGLSGLAVAACGSASAAAGGAAARAWRCWWRRARRSISTSRASRSYLLGAPVEQARIDPDNAEILVQHLKCAAFELPFEAAARRFGDVDAERDRRRRAGVPERARASLHPRRRGAGGEATVYHWASDAYPANNVSLRSVGWDNFVIIDVGARQDDRRDGLARHAHDAARAGDLSARRRAVSGRAARLREPQGVRAQGRARLLHQRDDPRARERASRSRASRARARARRVQLSGAATSAWWRRSSATRRSSSTRTRTSATARCNLPEMQMHTTAFWLTVPEPVVERQAVRARRW